MRKATLIVNPAAGRAALFAKRRLAIESVLARHGYASEVVQTTAESDSAARLAAEAAKTSALVLACGGDGTVHGVVQGLARSGVPLGVVPLGTANALARNLKLSLDPLAAVERLMSYSAREVPLGEIRGADGTRWFCLMAGCGPAGTLVHTMAQGSRLKARFGRSAYYAHAARLFLSRRWTVFRVEYRTAADAWESVDAIAMMASWVADLGGLFSGVAYKPSVMEEGLHVQIVRAPAWISLPAWMLCGGRNPWVDELKVKEFRCVPLDARSIYVQADAEPMGVLPFAVRVEERALTLLKPQD